MTAVSDQNAEQTAALEAAKAEIDRKRARLRDVEPLLLDLSLREPVTGSPLGHTIDDKWELLELTASLGLRERIIASLSAEDTVDERFLIALRDKAADLSGCFAFVAPGRLDGARFEPDPTMIKFASLGMPNAVFHIDISASRRARQGITRDSLLRIVAGSVAWTRARLPAGDTGLGRLYVNLSDLMDCFRDEPEHASAVVAQLSAAGIDGLMYEDPRGTFFPFEHGAVTRWLRQVLPAPIRILVHPHAGNGLEHASVIESVLAGGDGAWLGFTSHAATNGHASGLVYLTNLLRAGNPRVAELFSVEQFVPSARRMAEIHGGRPLHDQEPVAGDWAYREVLGNFSQAGGFPGDLPADRVGATAGWRIAPAIAGAEIVAGRLRETGLLPNAGPDLPLVAAMVKEIRESLLAGRKVAFDDEKALGELLQKVRSRVT